MSQEPQKALFQLAPGDVWRRCRARRRGSRGAPRYRGALGSGQAGLGVRGSQCASGPPPRSSPARAPASVENGCQVQQRARDRGHRNTGDGGDLIGRERCSRATRCRAAASCEPGIRDAHDAVSRRRILHSAAADRWLSTARLVLRRGRRPSRRSLVTASGGRLRRRPGEATKAADAYTVRMASGSTDAVTELHAAPTTPYWRSASRAITTWALATLGDPSTSRLRLLNAFNALVCSRGQDGSLIAHVAA